MSSTHRQKIKYGEGDDFTLYMFKEDLEMIERWFTRWNSTGKERPSESYLYGLLTNTLNPVCHIVSHANDILVEEYHFIKNIKNSQFENPRESPFFSLIGGWSFEQLTEDVNQEIKSRQDTSALPQRFVFLSVDQDQQNHFAYRPLLFIKEVQKVGKGRIEPLQGQNPYRSPYSSLNLERKEQRGRTNTGQVASLCNKFEKVSTKTMPKTSPNSTGRYNTSYASVTKQGTQGIWSRETDKTTSFTSYRETPPNPPEIFKEPKSNDVMDHSFTAQWYDTRPDVLRSTLDSVRSLAHNQNTVNITRDKTTLDMTIQFEHHNYEWLIEFPCGFPSGTVKLKKKFGFDNANSCSIEGLGSIEYFKAKVESTLQAQCVHCKNYVSR